MLKLHFPNVAFKLCDKIEQHNCIHRFKIYKQFRYAPKHFSLVLHKILCQDIGFALFHPYGILERYFFSYELISYMFERLQGLQKLLSY